MIFYIVGGVVALGLGIYIGLGWPGLPGREDRVVPRRSARSQATRHFTPLDLMRRTPRDGERRFLTNRPDPDRD